MTRLLVLSAGAGAGHNRAAEAVREHAVEAGVGAEWFDSLSFTGRVFRTLYAESYIWMASHSPALWGMLYRVMGDRVEQPNVRKLMKTYDSLNYRRLMRRVEEARPDAIICTHFLPANVARAHLGDAGVPVFTVLTDLDVHRFWIGEGIAGYFAGNDQVAWQLGKFGVPADRIHITGIPIHPSFSRTRGRDVVRKELSLAPQTPVVLFMSGGFGMGNMEEALERLIALPTPFQLVVVAGKNEKMRGRLAKIARASARQARVFGFVPNPHDFMEAADVMVSKAGGLTTSECLARGLPLIVYSPVPGQEERNADFLTERGAAVQAPTLDLLEYKVRELLEDPPRLARMKSSAAATARPLAGREIVARVVEHLGSRIDRPSHGSL
ncbi:MAG TPA: glycosyltransferase [Planctomycetota bacterium]